MKIGVCFSGQLRTGVWAIPAIKSFIGDLWKDCDFFVHTWDSQYNKNYSDKVINDLSNLISIRINYKNPDRLNWAPVETADLNRFLSIYNPKLFLIENYKTTADSIEEYRRNFITQYNLPAGQEYFPPLMYYSYYRSVEMLQEYERQHKINYDIIVKLRPDVIFPMQDGGDTYYHAQADLEKDITNVLSNPNALYQTSDLYWVSTGDTIKKANLFWEESLKAPNVSLWSYIRDVGIDLKKSENLDYTLLRNLWRHIPVDNYFMIDAFERFFLELPPKVNAVKNPGEDFHKQHFSELKSYIHNYSIIKELCDETGCTVN